MAKSDRTVLQFFVLTLGPVVPVWVMLRVVGANSLPGIAGIYEAIGTSLPLIVFGLILAFISKPGDAAKQRRLQAIVTTVFTVLIGFGLWYGRNSG